MAGWLPLLLDVLTLVTALRRDVRSECARLAPLRSDEEEYPGDDFVYDVVARTNEGVVSNVDTADLALLAVLTAVAAVVVFGIDKFSELAPPWQWLAYSLLACSALSCSIGYGIRLLKAREPIDPHTFMIDFAERPAATTTNAILGTVAAYYPNATDRKIKRIAVAVALTSLILGTLVMAVARSAPGMIRCM